MAVFSLLVPHTSTPMAYPACWCPIQARQWLYPPAGAPPSMPIPVSSPLSHKHVTGCIQPAGEHKSTPMAISPCWCPLLARPWLYAACWYPIRTRQCLYPMAVYQTLYILFLREYARGIPSPSPSYLCSDHSKRKYIFPRIFSFVQNLSLPLLSVHAFLYFTSTHSADSC